MGKMATGGWAFVGACRERIARAECVTHAAKDAKAGDVRSLSHAAPAIWYGTLPGTLPRLSLWWDPFKGLAFIVLHRVARYVSGCGRQAIGRLAVQFAFAMRFEYCTLDFRRRLSAGVADRVPCTPGLWLCGRRSS
jgi:hypothetical protein